MSERRQSRVGVDDKGVGGGEAGHVKGNELLYGLNQRTTTRWLSALQQRRSLVCTVRSLVYTYGTCVFWLKTRRRNVYTSSRIKHTLQQAHSRQSGYQVSMRSCLAWAVVFPPDTPPPPPPPKSPKETPSASMLRPVHSGEVRNNPKHFAKPARRRRNISSTPCRGVKAVHPAVVSAPSFTKVSTIRQRKSFLSTYRSACL